MKLALSGEIGKVGKKGELFPPKSIREKLGFKPNSKVRYTTTPKGELIVKKIFSISELLDQEPIAFVSVDEIEKLSEEIQNTLGKLENENIS